MYADQHKTWETREDRGHEVDTMQHFSEVYGWRFQKEEGEQDFKLYRDLGYEDLYCAIVECKWRNTPAERFNTYTIDQSKLRRLQARGKRDGVLALLIVSWPGVTESTRDRRFLNVTRLDLSALVPTIIKRRDRDEKADLGFHIPMNLFQSF